MAGSATLTALPLPDWSAPLDVQWYQDNAPSHLVVKGMSLIGVLDAVKAEGRVLSVERPYGAYKDYPVRELVALLIRAAREAFSDLPPREAMRRIGWHQLDVLRTNLVFRVMFAGLGQALGIHAVATLAPRAWAATANHERVEVLVNESRHVRVRMREIWTFPDCFQVGIVEGALRGFRTHPRIGVRLESHTGAEIDATW